MPRLRELSEEGRPIAAAGHSPVPSNTILKSPPTRREERRQEDNPNKMKWQNAEKSGDYRAPPAGEASSSAPTRPDAGGKATPKPPPPELGAQREDVNP